MTDWRHPDRGPDRTRWVAAAAMAVCAAVAAWLLLFRPPAERVSSNGFDLGGPGPGLAPRAGRSETGLAFVRRGESSGTPTAPGGGAPASAAAASAAAPAGEAPAAGVPADATGLRRLGAGRDLLTALTMKLLDHPRVLRAVFDNKLVVDALMGRETSQRNCSNPGALQAILADPSSRPMIRLLPVAKAVLDRPDAAAALAGTEMATRILACPSVQALTSDPGAIAAIVTANPQTIGLIADPRVARALEANPQAASLLGSVQSSLGKAR